MKARRPEQIVKDICLDYLDISQEQIERDCVKFFEDLGRLGFLADEVKGNEYIL